MRTAWGAKARIWLDLALLVYMALIGAAAVAAAVTGEWFLAAFDGVLACAGLSWVHERMTTRPPTGGAARRGPNE